MTLILGAYVFVTCILGTGVAFRFLWRTMIMTVQTLTRPFLAYKFRAEQRRVKRKDGPEALRAEAAAQMMQLVSELRQENRKQAETIETMRSK